MPRRAPSPCRHQGCPALVDRGFCPAHQKAAQRVYRATRGTTASRGYGARWTTYSRQYRREHPLCVVCAVEGRTVPSEHVDHIVPVHGPDDPQFWCPDNHRATCHSCHSRVTVQHDGGFGKARSLKPELKVTRIPTTSSGWLW
jgi:5-methylcytosine-specific restriction protein A